MLAVILAATISVCSLAASPGFSNFVYSDAYKTGQFHDVKEADWFSRYVQYAYNYGFFRGKSDTEFDPGGLLSLGEAVTLAARLNCIYLTGSADFPESIPYYAVYVDYALSNGIIDSHLDYSAPATRARFAQLVYNALPAHAFPVINDIPDYGICDVVPETESHDAIYALYRAGILSGSDRYGTFLPRSNITRAEACAIMIRLAAPAYRMSMKLPSGIPAEVIFTRSVNAVIMLETFDSEGVSIRTGSGFFISETGYAVTNLHVIENAASATVTLYNGDVYPLRGVHAISEEFNLIIVSIESDRQDWNYLNLADSDLIESGNDVYALGSPRALINTITDGIVSNKSRDVGGESLIQFTAPISFGSGGSAVLNTLGQVIGVASSSFSYGQNLNLAVPINHLKNMEPGELMTLEELLSR